MKANISVLISKLQIIAVVLMIAGLGWSGGNFTPQDAPAWNYLLHCIPVVLLLIISLLLFQMRDETRQGAANIGRTKLTLSIFSVVVIIGTIVMIVLGSTNPDPNAIGVKTFADWLPTSILNLGTLLWLGTAFFARGKHVTTAEAAVGV